MGKPLDQVTDEDLARNGLADFESNPRRIMPWRTEQHRLTGIEPTDEEWRAVLASIAEEEDRRLAWMRSGIPFEYRHSPQFGRF